MMKETFANYAEVFLCAVDCGWALIERGAALIERGAALIELVLRS
ncbi:hypothetical protein [Sporosarcina sp. P13]|nr:hypothetical protein [Sporosarcina sp. P13]